jgi:hypothetical protein
MLYSAVTVHIFAFLCRHPISLLQGIGIFLIVTQDC